VRLLDIWSTSELHEGDALSTKIWTTVSVTALAPGIFVKLKFSNDGDEYIWPAVALLHQRWTDPESHGAKNWSEWSLVC
jgi:hypothetical protein